MQKEQITDKEAISLIIVFVMGSSLILGIGGDAKNDAWIAGIVGIIMVIPLLLVYSRILSLYQGKLQRIEITVSIVFIFSVFIKSSICLLVACKGIGKMFNLKDYRSIVIQTGLLMVYFSYIIYDNIIEMTYWALKVYPYYAFPMQVILPIIIWILAEIKSKKISSAEKRKVVPNNP